jgi:hypothetical protein
MHVVCMYVTHIPAQMLAGKTPSPGTLNVKGAGYYPMARHNTSEHHLYNQLCSAYEMKIDS